MKLFGKAFGSIPQLSFEIQVWTEVKIDQDLSFCF